MRSAAVLRSRPERGLGKTMNIKDPGFRAGVFFFRLQAADRVRMLVTTR